MRPSLESPCRGESFLDVPNLHRVVVLVLVELPRIDVFHATAAEVREQRVLLFARRLKPDDRGIHNDHLQRPRVAQMERVERILGRVDLSLVLGVLDVEVELLEVGAEVIAWCGRCGTWCGCTPCRGCRSVSGPR